MTPIAEHELVINEDGEMALLLEPIAEEVLAMPTLLVVESEAKAYLDLGGAEPHEIIGIHPDVLVKLCETEHLLVVEIKDNDVVRTYDAAVGVFDEALVPE